MPKKPFKVKAKALLKTPLKRRRLARKLLLTRYFDKKRAWTASYNASLSLVSECLVDVEKQVKEMLARKRKRKLRVLDLGCGGGLALKQLYTRMKKENLAKKIELTGTSVSRDRKWRTGEGKNINWVVVHAEQLTRKFPANHFDFIYSNLGLFHAFNLKKALLNVKQVMKKKGVLVFNHKKSRLPFIPGLKKIKTEKRVGRKIVWLQKE